MDENDATDANTARDATSPMQAADEVIKNKSIDKDETLNPQASIENKTTEKIKPIPPGTKYNEIYPKYY